MPVITLQSPWEAAANVATDFVKERQNRADERAAEQDAETKNALTNAQRLETARKNSVDEALAQARENREALNTASEIRERDVNTRIHAAAEERAKAMQPLELQKAHLAIQVQQGTIAVDKARAIGLEIENKIKNVDADIKSKYGEATAAAILMEHRAGTAEKLAQTQHAEAQTAHENVLTQGESRKLATGGFDYHPSRGRQGDAMGAQNLQGIEKLSPKGRQMFDMLENTNNPTTQGQALLLLQKSALPESDKQFIAQYVSQKGPASGMVSQATQQTSQNREVQYGRSDTALAEKLAHRQATAWLGSAMAPQGPFDGVDPALRTKFGAYVFNNNVGRDGAIRALQAVATSKTPIQGSPVTPDEAQTLLQKLAPQ